MLPSGSFLLSQRDMLKNNLFLLIVTQKPTGKLRLTREDDKVLTNNNNDTHIERISFPVNDTIRRRFDITKVLWWVMTIFYIYRGLIYMTSIMCLRNWGLPTGWLKVSDDEGNPPPCFQRQLRWWIKDQVAPVVVVPAVRRRNAAALRYNHLTRATVPMRSIIYKSHTMGKGRERGEKVYTSSSFIWSYTNRFSRYYVASRLQKSIH